MRHVPIDHLPDQVRRNLAGYHLPEVTQWHHLPAVFPFASEVSAHCPCGIQAHLRATFMKERWIWFGQCRWCHTFLWCERNKPA